MSNSRYTIEDIKEKVKNTKAFLFDFDGTIANLDQLNVDGFKKVFKQEYDLDFSKDDFMTYVSGRGSKNGISKYLETKGIRDFSTTNLNDLFKKEKQSLLENNLNETVYLMPDIKDFLNHIQNNNQRKIIVTSSSKDYVKTVLTNFNIYDQFEIVFDRNSVIKGKPHPDPFLKGLEYLQLDNSECIAFEDSFYGLQSAKGAGLFTIGILNKGWNDDFVDDLSDYVISSYQELL